MFKIVLKKHPHFFALCVFLLFSLLLLVPQLSTKGMVTGADLIFHYNRFYDTAMQIKEGNFSYMLSLYGYQQSGRIVNALYGPYFAYLQGGVLLLSGTWFRYQILSNVLLGTLSGFSMYALMRQLKVRYAISLVLPLFFMTTYSIQYWWATQGFTSWGVALFPLCLIPAFRFLEEKKVPVFMMAGAVALMLQVHMLSTFFLVLAYAILFLIGWLPSKEKWKIVGQVALSVGIFLLLTINIWLPLVAVNLTNTLLPPFVNRKFVQSTVTWFKISLLYYPYPVPIFLLVFAYLFRKKGKTHSGTLKGMSWLAIIFFVLSTNLFPWQLLAGKGIALVELIQFPFRFFLYATALILVAVGGQVSLISPLWQKKFLRLSLVATLVGVGFVWYESYKEIYGHYYSDSFLQKRIHTTISGDADELRASFYSRDLGQFIDLAQKSTPDYVPDLSERTTSLNNKESDNKYHLYRDQVILPNSSFKKKVEGTSLSISWTEDDEMMTTIPIVVYKDSQLLLNGQPLSLSQTSLSSIGVPTVQSQKGENTLLLTYKEDWWLQPVIVVSLLSWLGWLSYYSGYYRKERTIFSRNELNK